MSRMRGTVTGAIPTTDGADPPRDIVSAELQIWNEVRHRAIRFTFYGKPGEFAPGDAVTLTITKDRNLSEWLGEDR